MSGHTVPRPNDINQLNADAVASYQQWTRGAVEEKFATTLTAFEHFLLDLQETAFEHERIHFLLRIMVIDHYKGHRLPNGPEV